MPKKMQLKQDEAYDRAQRHDGRSVKQQLALLDKRPGQAKRERAKLEKLIEVADDEIAVDGGA